MTADEALGRLLDELAATGYRFVPPTPATHARVVARRAKGDTLRDALGWSLPFDRTAIPPAIFDLLETAGMVERTELGLRSLVRVASVGECLFLHSAFPTESPDSVFFGPDSYRFADFLAGEIGRGAPVARLVDIGAGSGVGGIVAARLMPGCEALLADINPLALRFAAINARHNGVSAKIVEGPGLDPVEGSIVLAVSNPPFMQDSSGRAYRDGGGMLGAALSLQWASDAAARLSPGGRMLLYSASAIVDGADALKAALLERLAGLGCTCRYRELDPDIFGEQLDEPGYEAVERIAAIGVVITREPSLDARAASR